MSSLASDPGAIRLARGVPPAEAIPAEDLCAQARAVLNDMPQAVFQYAALGRNRGDAELRWQLGAFHDVDPDRLFVGNGSLQVLDLLTTVLSGNAPFDVLVETPTYDRALRIFERHGARVIGLPMQPDGLDIEALRRELQSCRPAFLYTIPDFQNPTGATLALGKRQVLVELAREHRFAIVEDIPYRELRYAGESLPTLAQLGKGARVITVGSLSKILSPGLRIGYAIADESTAGDLAEMAENTYLSAPPLCQAIAARCLASGVVRANVRRTRELLKERHDRAVPIARDVLGDRLFVVPGGGYFMSAQLHTRVPEPALIAQAAERGVVINSGRAFYPARAQPPEGAFFLRIPFQCLSPEQLALGLRTIRGLAEGD